MEGKVARLKKTDLPQEAVILQQHVSSAEASLMTVLNCQLSGNSVTII